jgi:hypothetical protein
LSAHADKKPPDVVPAKNKKNEENALIECNSPNSFLLSYEKKPSGRPHGKVRKFIFWKEIAFFYPRDYTAEHLEKRSILLKWFPFIFNVFFNRLRKNYFEEI